MPTYTYLCNSCNLKFDKSFMKVKNTESECPDCSSISRRVPSLVNIGKAGTSQESTDILIGKVSEKRWEDINHRKEERNQLRKESNNQAVSRNAKIVNGKIKYEYNSVTKERLKERKAHWKELKKYNKDY